jgi:unsaturated rhamnogalacturonyl hydrolase
MRKFLYFITGICLLLSLKAFGQAHPDSTWGVKFSNTLLVRYKPNINNMTGKGWEYSNSIILHGMEKIYAYAQNPAYLSYIQNYVDSYVNGTGAISGLGVSLDKIHPGLLLLFLYEKTGLLKYKTAATNLRNYILTGTTFPKTPDGGYWHKNNAQYNNVMMLDGIYMAHPFLAKYGAMFNDALAMNTATGQTLQLANHNYSASLHLALHAWHYDKSKSWANTTTGVSSQVWSRAMGWYTMAIVDILKYLPSSHTDYIAMHALLDSLVIGVKNMQDPGTGLWWHVMDKGGMTGNYLETSGSAMFVYALKTAADSGWIDPGYLSVARKGWKGVKSKISVYTDAMPMVNDFAPAMSVQNDYAGYISYASVDCPAASGTQHPHGYASVLMASSAMEFPIYTLDTTAFHGTIYMNPKGITYTNGDTVRLIAIPDPGYKFSLWSGNITGTSDTIKIIVNSNKSIIANFSLTANIINIKTNTIQADFTVYPNPLPNSTLNFQLNNFEKGIYHIKVINTCGQIILSRWVNFNVNTTSLSIEIPPDIIKGTYILQLAGNNLQVSKHIMVE